MNEENLAELKKTVIAAEIEKTHKLIIGAELHIGYYTSLKEGLTDKKKADLEMKILQLEDGNKFNKGFLDYLATL